MNEKFPKGYETYIGHKDRGVIILTLPRESSGEWRKDLYEVQRKCCGKVELLSGETIYRSMTRNRSGRCHYCHAVKKMNPLSHVPRKPKSTTHEELENIPPDILQLAMSTKWL